MAAGVEIREEGHREITVGERNSARHIARGRAEKDGQKKLANTKTKSQNPCHMRSLMWPPTSSEIPRKIKHHKMRKSAR